MPFRKIAALLALPMMLTGARGAPVPLQPSSDWELNRTPGMCYLSRSFGHDGDATRVTFDAMPGQSFVGMTVAVPDGMDAWEGGISAKLLPGGQTIATQAMYVRLPGGNAGMRSNVDMNDLAKLDSASMLVVDAHGGRIAVALNPPAEISAAFKACFADLYRKWNIDGSKMMWTPRRFERTDYVDPRTFFRTNDYPAAASRSSARGDSTALIEIGPDGRARSCRLLDGTGNDALDAVTCKGAMRTQGFKRAGYITYRMHWNVK